MKQALQYAIVALLLGLGGSTLAANIEAGKAKGNTCLGCHGIANYHSTYPSYRVPKLAGQNADYIVAALKGYKSGERQHATMSPQAKSLSEQDMQDIAAWFSQMEVK